MNKERVQIFWLMPAAPYRDLFRDLIRILARRFDAPPFQPHLTLGKASSDYVPAVKTGPIRLAMRKLECSSKFTKTLFVRFQPNDSLDRLVSELGGRGKPVRDPHLSLIYARLPAPIKRELADTIQLPFAEVVFDRIQLMSCRSPTESAADVESWRVVASRRLRG
jgi:putative hydrolase of the HAD superfamily